MHDVTGQSSRLVGKEILHLEQTDKNVILGNSYLRSLATDYEKEDELTWPSSSLRLDVRAMAGVSVSA